MGILPRLVPCPLSLHCISNGKCDKKRAAAVAHASAPMHSHATWPTMRRLSYNEMQMAAENAGFGFREANNQRDERRDTFAALRRR